jgi:superfamily II DNA/RNA helicase
MQIPVSVTGDNRLQPIDQFSDTGFCPLLLENINKCGYREPSSVQKHAIPIILAGRDLMACAQTGTGKTTAFLLPIIQM